MPSKIVTGKQLCRLMANASAGHDTDVVVSVSTTMSRPRLYDEATDFATVADDGWFGCYIIYMTCCDDGFGPSRIQYIGKGWMDQRGKSHLNEKRSLRLLSREHELKYVLMSWLDLDYHDDDGAWLCEQIMLQEHIDLFGGLPKYNKAPPTSDVAAWRRVLRWTSPGTRALLNRYGM